MAFFDAPNKLLTKLFKKPTKLSIALPVLSIPSIMFLPLISRFHRPISLPRCLGSTRAGNSVAPSALAGSACTLFRAYVSAGVCPGRLAETAPHLLERLLRSNGVHGSPALSAYNNRSKRGSHHEIHPGTQSRHQSAPSALSSTTWSFPVLSTGIKAELAGLTYA